MALAVKRGCKFKKIKSDDLTEYDAAGPRNSKMFGDALKDVTGALDYSDVHTYNSACIDDPGEVRRRIRAL